uniref:Putative uncharacterized protein FLJ38767 n=1 Tax=Homo sapiens TaxID=9606 RepID=YQ037_HUMAN|nr:RecName: Full=Putative uncharacterized protein FLJ38767 [Homo sapiens]
MGQKKTMGTERSRGGKRGPQPGAERPEEPGATFSKKPPEGARAPRCLSRPTAPKSGACLARRRPPGSPCSIRDAPFHTGDDRFLARENFPNVLQPLPRMFAVQQAADFESQCPRRWDSRKRPSEGLPSAGWGRWRGRPIHLGLWVSGSVRRKVSGSHVSRSLHL